MSVVNWEAVKKQSVVFRAGVLCVPWGKTAEGEPIKRMRYPSIFGPDVTRELTEHFIEPGRGWVVEAADYIDRLVLQSLLAAECVAEVWKSKHHDWVYPMVYAVEEANAEFDAFVLPADEKAAGFMAGKDVYRSPHTSVPVGGMWSDIILHHGCEETVGPDGRLSLFLDCFIRHPAAFAKAVDK